MGSPLSKKCGGVARRVWHGCGTLVWCWRRGDGNARQGEGSLEGKDERWMAFVATSTVVASGWLQAGGRSLWDWVQSESVLKKQKEGKTGLLCNFGTKRPQGRFAVQAFSLSLSAVVCTLYSYRASFLPRLLHCSFLVEPPPPLGSLAAANIGYSVFPLEGVVAPNEQRSSAHRAEPSLQRCLRFYRAQHCALRGVNFS